MTPKKPPKLPAIQFYPSDWINDHKVQSLSWHDKAVWLELLFIMHMAEERGKLTLNGNKMSDVYLSKRLGMQIQLFKKSIANIIAKNVAYVDENGIIYNKRMVKDEALRHVRAEAGTKGGNPNLVKQNSETRLPAKTTPSTSVSTSTSASLLNTDRVNELRQKYNDNPIWLDQASAAYGITTGKIKTFCTQWITQAQLRYQFENYPVTVLAGYMITALEKAKPTLIPKEEKKKVPEDFWN